MSAQPGNKLASKWTLEKTLEVLSIIEKESRKDWIVFLYEALDIAGIHRNTWQYWYRIWADHEEIIGRMELIDQRFEVKILKGVSRRDLNAGFGTMLLKSKYGYIEERYRYRKSEKAEDAE